MFKRLKKLISKKIVEEAVETVSDMVIGDNAKIDMIEGLKDRLVKQVNKKVDLPILNEEQEEALFEALADIVIGILKVRIGIAIKKIMP